MTKFKVGDRVKAVNASAGWGGVNPGDIGVVTRTAQRGGSKGYTVDFKAHPNWNAEDADLEPITNEGGARMARKTYKLLKDLPDIRKGALFQEACDDGDQEYKMITLDYFTHPESRRALRFDDNNCMIDRDSVEQEPQWFVEVFPVTPQYMTQAELDQWEAFKATKPAKAAAKKKAGRPARAKAA